MHSDHCYFIGHSHEVCQDYARSGTTYSGSVYAIVSDGCSSSPDTDIGARLLTIEAEASLLLCGDISSRENGLQDLRILDLAQRKIGGTVSSQALDATLITAIADPKLASIRMWGDGVIILDYGDQATVTMVDYEPNIPPYLSYLLDTVRADEWHSISPTRQVTTFSLEKINGEWSSSNATPQLSKGALEPFEMIDFPTPHQIIITTDGSMSFCPPGNIELIAMELLKSKSMTGKWLLRRTKRMLRELADKDIRNADDIAVAGICSE